MTVEGHAARVEAEHASRVIELAAAPRPRTVYRRAIRASLRRRGGRGEDVRAMMGEPVDHLAVEHRAAEPGTGALAPNMSGASVAGDTSPIEISPLATLPDTLLVLRGTAVDIERLAAYARVCGFRLTDALPVTYPHVLAFPLAMQLMSAPDFPFSVVGLVHVGNRITQARPIGLGEPLDFTVRVDGLRPHARGRQFDVIATATVDGAEVWHGVSTYLRRDKSLAREESNGGNGVRHDHTPDGVPLRGNGMTKSPELGTPTALWRVGVETGRSYAAVSGDRNPIHVSRVGARALGFARPIAHGMWTVARAVAALEGRLADTYTVDVAFRRPLPLPSTVAWWASRDSGGWTIAVTDAESDRSYLTGSIAPA